MKRLIEYAKDHQHLWRDEHESYWLARLQQEVAELVLTLDKQHDGPREHELLQIATICINWLDMREDFEWPEEHDVDARRQNRLAFHRSRCILHGLLWGHRSALSTSYTLWMKDHDA